MNLILSLPAGFCLADATAADGPEHLGLVEGEHLRLSLLLLRYGFNN